MDPSLTVSNDPHHPPQFTSFPPFTNSNPQNHPFFGGAAVASTNNNSYLYQSPPPPPPQQSVTPHPSFNHPPYSDMICTAIAALNEPDGSSKQAISRYIERIYTGIPPAHGALLTHHLKTLKNNGILMMVKKSYKFAASPPPTSVAVAVAAASAGLELPRSDFPVNQNQPLPDPATLAAASATPQSQKRGRGRPPKPKPDNVQTNGKPTWEQPELPVSRPEEIHPLAQIQAQPLIQPQPPVKRPPGRPRKDGSSPSPTVKASVSGGVETVKRRGRPPSGRAAGRERKPAVVSAPVSVIPYVANGGVRRRGRPKRVDAGVSSVAQPPPPPSANAESGGQELAVVVVEKRRGRGRPPKIGGVIRKLMKPKRRVSRTGKPLGRPRKYPVSSGASGRQDGDYGELKKKFELFQAKVKDIVVLLKSGIGGNEKQAVVQAIQLLEELTEEAQPQPQHMEEVRPDEEHPETEAEPEGQGQPDEEHPETEPEPEGQGQAFTEAEAMQEALF